MTVLLVVVAVFVVASCFNEFQKRASLAVRLSNLNSQEISEFREQWKLWHLQNMAEDSRNGSPVPVYKPEIREYLESRIFLRQNLLESQTKFTQAHEKVTAEYESLMRKRRETTTQPTSDSTQKIVRSSRWHTAGHVLAALVILGKIGNWMEEGFWRGFIGLNFLGYGNLAEMIGAAFVEVLIWLLIIWSARQVIRRIVGPPQLNP